MTRAERHQFADVRLNSLGRWCAANRVQMASSGAGGIACATRVAHHPDDDDEGKT